MFLGREPGVVAGGRTASEFCRVHLFRREGPPDTSTNTRGASETSGVVCPVEPAGSLGLDVLQTPGADAAFFSCGRGAGLWRLRGRAAAAMCVLFDAQAFVRDARAAGAIT